MKGVFPVRESVCVLYNPKAGNGHGEDAVHKLDAVLSDSQLRYQDITNVDDYFDFFHAMAPGEQLLVAGGDGTLNHFVNDTEGIRGDMPVWYYPTGSGNDFWKDIGQQPDGMPVEITHYLSQLPVVRVNGQSRLFLNGIGFGIDGYCCEVGDRLRNSTSKPINYAGIAVKGLLFHYHPTAAAITVDGKTSVYRKVWLAPTMYGRYYGGGMMPTPKQNRESRNHTVSCMIMHDSGKMRTLSVFPSIFKGEHINHANMVTILEGHQISVCFDQPAALQIDGETVRNVLEYSVSVPL